MWNPLIDWLVFIMFINYEDMSSWMKGILFNLDSCVHGEQSK